MSLTESQISQFTGLVASQANGGDSQAEKIAIAAYAMTLMDENPNLSMAAALGQAEGIVTGENELARARYQVEAQRLLGEVQLSVNGGDQFIRAVAEARLTEVRERYGIQRRAAEGEVNIALGIRQAAMASDTFLATISGFLSKTTPEFRNGPIGQAISSVCEMLFGVRDVFAWADEAAPLYRAAGVEMISPERLGYDADLGNFQAFSSVEEFQGFLADAQTLVSSDRTADIDTPSVVTVPGDAPAVQQRAGGGLNLRGAIVARGGVVTTIDVNSAFDRARTILPAQASEEQLQRARDFFVGAADQNIFAGLAGRDDTLTVQEFRSQWDRTSVRERTEIFGANFAQDRSAVERTIFGGTSPSPGP